MLIAKYKTLMTSETIICQTPDETYEVGESIGRDITARDVLMISGGLGAGKTLMTKGIVAALGFDPDEVTSPSFSLVNLYPTTKGNVYHIDLWRLDEGADAAFAVGLDDILDDETAILIIEWPERLADRNFPGRILSIAIVGDGDDGRTITIDEKS